MPWVTRPSKIKPKAGSNLDGCQNTFMCFDGTVNSSIITIMSDIMQQYAQSSPSRITTETTDFRLDLSRFLLTL